MKKKATKTGSEGSFLFPDFANQDSKEKTNGDESYEGRDEMNLAEFPLSVLTDDARGEVKTLTFEDQVYDKSVGMPVRRRLIVTGSEQYGLPACTDSDVLLAMIQLTHRSNNFTSRTVQFSRYELVRLLKWPAGGRQYERIEEAINRWLGVTLYYDRAWWDKKQKAWVDEKFHVLDRASLTHGTNGLCAFTWNEVIFRSFQSDNLKKIDLARYFGLRLPTSRRIFRFMDKRFLQRPIWKMDLKTFACEHVGLSRGYSPSQLRRKLLPALRELEEDRFLRPLAEGERFECLAGSSWTINLVRREEKEEAMDPLVAALVGEGVTKSTAEEILREHDEKVIRRQVEIYRWLKSRKDGNKANGAGFLVQSIRENYTAPADFFPSFEREAAEARKRQEFLEMQSRIKQEQQAEQDRKDAIKRYFDNLTPGEQEALWKEAMATATPSERLYLQQHGGKGSWIADGIRRNLLDKATVKRMSVV